MATTNGFRRKRALIVGGGIAGPAAAIALHRARVDATVYEASETPRDNAGAFLNLAPNGIHALQGLGVGHLIDGIGFTNDRLVFRNESGRELANVPVGGITVMRGALSRALREAAEALGVRFELGKALDSVELRDRQLFAGFADGTDARGDVLIGADGIRSRVRARVCPTSPEPTYTGILNLGGVVHTDLPSTGTAMHMIFGRRGFFGYAVRPSGETYWFSNFAEPAEPAALKSGDPMRVGASRYRDRLLAIHQDDPPEVTRILSAISGDIGAYPIYDLGSLPSWRKGAVCLIGDAAHAIGPHVGQGASLALEDAFVVAKCLRDIPDIPAAFEAFERIRRARVEPIAVQSRRTGQQKAPAGWLGRKVRDLILPIFLRQSARAAAELYEYRLDWDTAVAQTLTN